MRKEMASKLEKVLEKLLNSKVVSFNPPKNFDSVKVDIYPGHYGIHCHITFLMKKPFSQKDSDFFNYNVNLKPFIKSAMGDIFDGGVQSSQSTIESYGNQSWWYEQKKQEGFE